MSYYADVNKILGYIDRRIKEADSAEEKKVLKSVSSQLILRTPKEDVAPIVRANWITTEIRSLFDGKGIKVTYCSNCRTLGRPHAKYCNECGAIMQNKLSEFQ